MSIGLELERGRQKQTLQQLRSMRGVKQVDLAERMGLSQSRISQLENAPNLHVSTLRAYIEALGGQLEIAIVFPDATYKAVER